MKSKDRMFDENYMNYNAINSIYLTKVVNKDMKSYDSFRNLSSDTIYYYGFSYGINETRVCCDPDIRTLSDKQANITKELVKRLEKKLKRVTSTDNLDKYISIERVDGTWENYVYDDERIENIFKINSLDCTPGGNEISAPFLVFCDSDNSKIANFYLLITEYIKNRKYSDMYKYLNEYVFDNNCKLSFPYLNEYCANKKQIIKLIKKSVGFIGYKLQVKHFVNYNLYGYLDERYNSKTFIKLEIDNKYYAIFLKFNKEKSKIINIEIDQFYKIKYNNKYLDNKDIFEISKQNYNDFID